MYYGYNYVVNRKKRRKKPGRAAEAMTGPSGFEQKMREYSGQIERGLAARLLEGVTVRASDLIENWFPAVEADIFISHSHADREIALDIAEDIYSKYGLVCFIDSCIWGYSEDLVAMLLDKYKGETDRTEASRYVDTLLTAALMQMIHNTECVFLINTPTSIKKDNKGGIYTDSRWIYMELEATRMLKRSVPKRYFDPEYQRKVQKPAPKVTLTLPILFDVNLDHLFRLNNYEMMKWGWECDDARNAELHPLDMLYNVTSGAGAYERIKLIKEGETGK